MQLSAMTTSSALSFDTRCSPITGTGHVISIRPASLADLDAMLDIGLAAMPLDPQWNWRFPHRFEFPDDHRKFTRNVYRSFLENKSGNWAVMLAEVAEEDSIMPAAFAVWNLSNFATENSGYNS